MYKDLEGKEPLEVIKIQNFQGKLKHEQKKG